MGLAQHPIKKGAEGAVSHTDQREGDQIRERERAREARLARPGPRVAWVVGLGLTQPRLPSLCGLGGLIFSQFNLFFFFPCGSDFFFCRGCCFVIYGLINRVFKTRFSSGRHVKNDATSDVSRP